MLEAIALALVFGSFWFWVVSLTFFGIVLALAENEHNWWAGISVVAFILVMQWAGTISLFANPLQLLFWLFAYFAFGTTWSFIKWFSLLHKKKDKLLEVKARWVKYWNKQSESERQGEPTFALTGQTIEPGTVAWTSFVRWVDSSDYRPNPKYGSLSGIETPDELIPNWMKHKKKLTGWILWWPTSLFWTLLNDPLVRLANWIYYRFQNVYRRMAASVFDSSI